MRVKKTECQNNECKYRVSNSKRGKDKRKRFATSFLEGHSWFKVTCPVCHIDVEETADSDFKGVCLYMNEDELNKAVKELEKYHFDESGIQSFLDHARTTLALWHVQPEQKVEKVLDKSIESVLELVRKVAK